MDEMLRLIQKNDIKAADVEKVEVGGNLSNYKTRAAGSFQSLALQEKTGFPFERERVCVCVAVRESCGVACEPFAPTIAPVRGSRQ